MVLNGNSWAVKKKESKFYVHEFNKNRITANILGPVCPDRSMQESSYFCCGNYLSIGPTSLDFPSTIQLKSLYPHDLVKMTKRV